MASKKLSSTLITLSSAAILAVYAAGYERTAPAAERFAAQTEQRLSAMPLPGAAPGRMGGPRSVVPGDNGPGSYVPPGGPVATAPGLPPSPLPATPTPTPTQEPVQQIAMALPTENPAPAPVPALLETPAPVAIPASPVIETSTPAPAPVEEAAPAPAASAPVNEPAAAPAEAPATEYVAPASEPVAPASAAPDPAPAAAAAPANVPTAPLNKKPDPPAKPAKEVKPPKAPKPPKVDKSAAKQPTQPAVQTQQSAPQPAPEPAQPVVQEPLWKDGTYYGWGTSRHGDIQAQVIIENGRIAAANIYRCETRYPCSWIEHAPGQVVQRQSPAVDIVAGATQSVYAFYYAVVEALSKAR